MLLRVQRRRLEAADHYGIVGEQRGGIRRKAAGQLLCRFNALPVIAVGCGTHQARQSQRLVAFDSAPDELVFPARLTFDVQHVAPPCGHIEHLAAPVVGAVALTGQWIELETQVVQTGGPGRQLHGCGGDAGARRQRQVFGGDQAAAVIDPQARSALVLVTDRHPRLQRLADCRRVVDGQLRQFQIIDHLPQILLAQAAAILRAVADQHDGRQRHAAGGLQHLSQRIANAGLRFSRRRLTECFDRLGMIGETEITQLGAAAQGIKRTGLQRRDGLLAPRLGACGHAGRVIDHDRHDVFAFAQVRELEHRAPQQGQDQCQERQLQQAERQQAPGA